MRQRFFCPNCGAPVVCGERFCINCGINFQWIIQPAGEQGATPFYGYQPNWGTGQPQPECIQQQEHHTGVIPEKTDVSGGDAVKPISTQISRLLADFEKHFKHEGTQQIKAG